MRALVILFASFLVTSAHADSLGTFVCSTSAPVDGKQLISINLDTNEISLLTSAQDTDDATAIFGSKVPTFCGYNPADVEGITCPFNTSLNENGNVTKDLTCNFGNGTAWKLTVGSLTLNLKTLTGHLGCRQQMGSTSFFDALCANKPLDT
jgi:hypothetical protein